MALEKIVKPWIRELEPYKPGKPAEELDRELAASGARSEPPASGGRPPQRLPSLKLASNESPLGPSPRALEAVRAALAGVHRYPDGASFGLRRKLAARLSVGEEQLVFGAGADEILELLAKVLLGPGDECVFAWPSFAMYPIVVRGMGARPVAVPLDAGLVHDLDAMARAVNERTRLVLVCNPNNPTGTSVGRDAFDRFAASLPADVVLAIDEAYVDFVRRTDFPDSLGWVARRPATIVLRTFSKAYGLAGLRVGYGIADPELAGYLQRARHPFNVNRLAEVAAEAALDDREYVERLRRVNAEGIEYLTRELRALGFEVWPSDANFLLAKPLHGGLDTFAGLLRQGVIVRPLASFGMPEHVRITVGLPEENARLVKALQRLAEGAA